MLAVLMVLILVPIVELYVMVQVAGVIGVLPTVALVVAMCLAGAWLMKVEGLGVLRRMQRQLNDGEVPTAEAVNGVLIVVGGLLMLVPGFVTGVLGLLLLLPPVRALLRPVVLARVQRRIDRGSARFMVFSAGSPTVGGRGPSSFGGRVYDADSHLDATSGPGGRPDG
ncbi:MAG: FxsA family protein, partial [Acidimicrobiales bacterium]